MEYSVIIATMWKDMKSLLCMLSVYEQCPYIREVIIINNDNANAFDLSAYNKVKIYSAKRNLYVIPAWRYGVSQAVCDKVIIANDDIIIEGEFDVLIEKINVALRKGDVVGFSSICFPNKREFSHSSTITLKKSAKDVLPYGFGVFMVLHKTDYYIPPILRVWYGDRYLYTQLNAWVITGGVKVITQMSMTTKTMVDELKKQRKIEQEYYSRNKYLFHKNKTSSVAIVCVLKEGGDFKQKDVLRLQRNIARYVTTPYTFYCLTDMSFEKNTVNCIPLTKNYPGWWSKIELFQSKRFKEEYILYFDLDTVICNNINTMLTQRRSFIGLMSLCRRRVAKNYMASGVMMWENTGKYDFLFNEFTMRQTTTFRGDQDYISDSLWRRKIKPLYWQNIVNGIYSYKLNYLTGQVLLDDITVLCFHGKPRPNDITDFKIARHYE